MRNNRTIEALRTFRDRYKAEAMNLPEADREKVLAAIDGGYESDAAHTAFLTCSEPGREFCRRWMAEECRRSEARAGMA